MQSSIEYLLVSLCNEILLIDNYDPVILDGLDNVYDASFNDKLESFNLLIGIILIMCHVLIHLC